MTRCFIRRDDLTQRLKKSFSRCFILVRSVDCLQWLVFTVPLQHSIAISGSRHGKETGFYGVGLRGGQPPKGLKKRTYRLPERHRGDTKVLRPVRSLNRRGRIWRGCFFVRRLELGDPETLFIIVLPTKNARFDRRSRILTKTAWPVKVLGDDDDDDDNNYKVSVRFRVKLSDPDMSEQEAREAREARIQGMLEKVLDEEDIREREMKKAMGCLTRLLKPKFSRKKASFTWIPRALNFRRKRSVVLYSAWRPSLWEFREGDEGEEAWEEVDDAVEGGDGGPTSEGDGPFLGEGEGPADVGDQGGEGHDSDCEMHDVTGESPANVGGGVGGRHDSDCEMHDVTGEGPANVGDQGGDREGEGEGEGAAHAGEGEGDGGDNDDKSEHADDGGDGDKEKEDDKDDEEVEIDEDDDEEEEYQEEDEEMSDAENVVDEDGYDADYEKGSDWGHGDDVNTPRPTAEPEVSGGAGMSFEESMAADLGAETGPPTAEEEAVFDDAVTRLIERQLELELAAHDRQQLEEATTSDTLENEEPEVVVTEVPVTATTGGLAELVAQAVAAMATPVVTTTVEEDATAPGGTTTAAAAAGMPGVTGNSMSGAGPASGGATAGDTTETGPAAAVPDNDEDMPLADIAEEELREPLTAEDQPHAETTREAMDES